MARPCPLSAETRMPPPCTLSATRIAMPRAILVVSAHWQKAMPVDVTSWESAPLIYDFGGFPEELYRIEYPAHGDAALARADRPAIARRRTARDPRPRPRA